MGTHRRSLLILRHSTVPLIWLLEKLRALGFTPVDSRNGGFPYREDSIRKNLAIEVPVALSRRRGSARIGVGPSFLPGLNQ